MSNAISSLPKVYYYVERIRFYMLKVAHIYIYISRKLTDDHSKKCAVDETSILKKLKYLNLIKPIITLIIIFNLFGHRFAGYLLK